ncbi:hypothetical protein [Pedobacter sp.]|uniref:hypothetical protein n=1 Tax=Pedobacter sp. TaxID=1411316 RepID=UPI002D1FBEC8|nr:hypothetical protein [Pedobacter sp.]
MLYQKKSPVWKSMRGLLLISGERGISCAVPVKVVLAKKAKRCKRLVFFYTQNAYESELSTLFGYKKNRKQKLSVFFAEKEGFEPPDL